jgi:TonB family protein
MGSYEIADSGMTHTYALMQRISIIFLLCLASSMSARAQSADPDRQGPGNPGAGLTEPQVLSTQISVATVEKCKKKGHDTITLYVLIDEQGRPQGYYFQNAAGSGVNDSILDFARDAIRSDTFAPAKRSGRPIAVRRAILLDIDVCITQVKEPGGVKSIQVAPLSLPVQTVLTSAAELAQKDGINLASEGSEAASLKDGISAPFPLTTVEARYSDEGRKHRVQGKCLIRLVVDKYGYPQNPRIIQPLDYGLGEKAVEAVLRYRFRPALKNHADPVPVLITVEVNFRLY